MVLLPADGGEATNLENKEYLYSSICSRVTQEEDGMHFSYWKVIDKYRDPVDPNSLLANFVAVFPEVAGLLSYHV